MQGTWSVEGIRLTLGYALALFSAALWARAVMRVHPPRGGEQAATPLTLTELAYLADGPRRVVQTAMAQLLDTGRLRVERDGRVHAAGEADGDPVEQAVLAGAASGCVPATLVNRLVHHPVVRAPSVRLAQLDLLTGSQASRLRRRIALLPLVVLALAGALRCAQLAWSGEPLVGVTALMVVTAGVLAAIPQAIAGRRTALGEEVLRQARQRLGERTAASAAELVALHGLLGYPDPRVRALLLNGSGRGTRDGEPSNAHSPGE